MDHLGVVNYRPGIARQGKASAVFRSFGSLQHGHQGRQWPVQTSINTSWTLPHSYSHLHAICIGKKDGSIFLVGTNPAQLEGFLLD